MIDVYLITYPKGLFMDCMAFFDRLESQINSGKRGAPIRREHLKVLREMHNLHVTRLRSGRSYRDWGNKRPEHKALVLERHGCNGGDPVAHSADLSAARTTTERMQQDALESARYQYFLKSMTLDERYQYYVENIMGKEEYFQTAAHCETWDKNHKKHFPREEASYFSELYRAKQENRIAPDGSIIRYTESVKWEEYGKRSYPRVVDRRLEKIVFTGISSESSLIRYLEKGEKISSAIQKLTKGEYVGTLELL